MHTVTENVRKPIYFQLVNYELVRLLLKIARVSGKWRVWDREGFLVSTQVKNRVAECN